MLCKKKSEKGGGGQHNVQGVGVLRKGANRPWTWGETKEKIQRMGRSQREKIYQKVTLGASTKKTLRGIYYLRSAETFLSRGGYSPSIGQQFK